MPDFQEISPVSGPVRGTIRPPGSKSITNRALILAALARGQSRLSGVLDSKDTQVMLQSLGRLGISAQHDVASRTCVVEGCGGIIPADSAELWLENSGTSIRFLTSLCALGSGRYRLDGIQRMRERPIRDLRNSLNALGAAVACDDEASGCPPLTVDGRSGQLQGGTASIQGNISSQFLSSLLMSLPAAAAPTILSVSGTLVSQPYVTMTLEMMRDFGVTVEHPADLSSFRIPNQPYTAQQYAIEPDASAASYFMGLAAVTEGRITIEGLSKTALQGDVEFAIALERMGCQVEWADDSVTVSGRPLHGVEIDMNAISDTAQTLATVAVFADSPTTIRNVAHMRHKETDRIAAVVTELNRAGILATEFEDGLQIHPGPPQPCEIKTYDDHRMAMSFSLLGLRAAGIRILDPDCTAKTYPSYFEDLDRLCRSARN